MMRSRWLQLLFVLLIFSQAALGSVGAGTIIARQFRETPPLVGSGSAIDPATTPLTIERGLSAASARAVAWDEHALLVAVSMQIDWPLSLDESPAGIASGGWITYTFAAPEENDAQGEVKETLGLFYERRTGSLIDARTLEWPSTAEFAELVLTTYPISSSTAVTAIEFSHGQHWRGQCPERRHVTRVSLAVEPNEAWWVVTYGESRSAEVALLARVDAQTGEIDQVTDRSEPCVDS